MRIIEFTNRGKNAMPNFQKMLELKNKNYPDLILCIGTIENKNQAIEFINIGADVLISPYFENDVLEVTNQNNILYIPACITPTERYYTQKCV